MEKITEYTTFDIKRLFGLKIDLLKDWMKRGYISPSIQKASGQGTKNIFSKDDLYFIMLFKHFVDRGFLREKAHEALSGIRWWYQNYPGDVDYILFVKRPKQTKPPVKKMHKSVRKAIMEGAPAETYILSEQMFKSKSLSEILIGIHTDREAVQLDFDDLVVVNFTKLKAMVDLIAG